MKYSDRYNAMGLAQLKEHEAAEGIYHAGNWRFQLAKSGEFCVAFNYDNSDWYYMRDTEDFSAVIGEAKKHGYNVNAEFLKDQIENILDGFKQNRILPDRSGAVFSPIRDNGIVFRFAPVTESTQEFIG